MPKPGDSSLDTVQKKKERVAMLSVASNSVLVIFKAIAGALIGSVSIISEAIHSGMDLLAAVIAFFAVRKSHAPADKQHPFGHGKLESISGLVEAGLIFIAAVWIIFEAFKKFSTAGEVEQPGWGVAVMLVSAIVNIFVSRKLFVVGAETDSLALQADAWHLRTDVYTSAGVMGSLAIIWGGGYFFPGVSLGWLDPAAAVIVAVIIMKAAWNLTARAVGDLMDMKLPYDEEQWIRTAISSLGNKLCGYHQLKTRKAGNFRFIEFHIKVDPQMTVETSHRIAHELKRLMRKKFPLSATTVHIEPCDGHCTKECLDGCFVPEGQRPAPIRRDG
jgi:cation diffusion facilitator family transporter